jgi:uncharacterized protein YbjQ (UPF0145 family)
MTDMTSCGMLLYVSVSQKKIMKQNISFFKSLIGGESNAQLVQLTECTLMALEE